MAVVQTEPPRYREWLTYLLDRPGEGPQWYFEPGLVDFEVSSEGAVDLITYTMPNCEGT